MTRLKYEMQEQKIKTEEIAKVTGKSEQTVRRWINGDTIPLPDGVKIAERLGITAEQLNAPFEIVTK